MRCVCNYILDAIRYLFCLKTPSNQTDKGNHHTSQKPPVRPSVKGTRATDVEFLTHIPPLRKDDGKRLIKVKLKEYNLVRDYAPAVCSFLFAVILSLFVSKMSEEGEKRFQERQKYNQVAQSQIADSIRMTQLNRDSVFVNRLDSIQRQLYQIILRNKKKK